MNTTTLLRQRLGEKTLVAMGVYDVFSAILVEKVGIDAVYVSGYLTSASFLGVPDLGLMSSSERITVARHIARRVKVPVLVDAEEGYGGPLNVIDTVQQLEMAGAAGIQIDDEEMPTQCQMFTDVKPKKLVSVEAMCQKIRAAVDARKDPDLVIMARSDILGTSARTSLSKRELMAEVVDRGNAYAQAGADMIFVYAQTPQEAEAYAKAISAPLCGLLGFVAPLSIANLEELGYRLVVCPLPVLASAARGILDALGAFQEKREWNSMVEFLLPQDRLLEILRLPEYAGLARRYQA